MQKKIIALAVAGLMSGAAFAQSNVTIYGIMHASWDSIDTDVSQQDRLKRINSNYSRIGFKGTEALGNGLSANWQIEQTVTLDNGTNTPGAAATAFGGGGLRNTYVGLSSKTLGEIRLGTHDTPYKMSTGGLDVFGDTIGDYNAIIGNFSGLGSATNGFDKRAASTALYLSPVWNGMQVTAHYGHDNEAGNMGLDNPSNWGGAVTYANGPLFASLAYERHNFADVAGAAAVAPVNGQYVCIDDAGAVIPATVAAASSAAGLTACQVINAAYDRVVVQTAPIAAVAAGAGAANDYRVSGTKFGLGYTFMGTTKVGFVYEHLNDSRDNSVADRNAWGLNVAHTMGNIVLKAAYMRAGDSDRVAVNDGAKNWALGLDYNMSKRTQAYVVYTKTTNDDNALFGLGHGHYNGAAATAGKDPSAVSFGLKHAF